MLRRIRSASEPIWLPQLHPPAHFPNHRSRKTPVPVERVFHTVYNIYHRVRQHTTSHPGPDLSNHSHEPGLELSTSRSLDSVPTRTPAPFKHPGRRYLPEPRARSAISGHFSGSSQFLLDAASHDCLWSRQGLWLRPLACPVVTCTCNYFSLCPFDADSGFA